MRGLNKMIFDRFFKAKHLSPDPQVRVAAISNLSLDKTSDKQALHELAFNDINASVSLAALEKLNSFALWLKASETSENARVKKNAHERVLVEVNNPDSNMLSQGEFDAFVAESKNLVLLEQMLFSNQRLQQNDALALAVLLKVNKQNTNRLYFKDIANNAQQQVIINRTDDANELAKLLKGTNDGALVAQINEKVEHLRALAALPIKLKQDATLLISKLLALKDNNSYEQIFENKQRLCQEFDTYKAQFSVLDEETAFLLAEKYLRVNESIEKRLAALKEDWQSANELKQTTNAIAEIEARFNEVKQQVDAILESIDDPSLLAQSKLLSNALDDVSLDVKDAGERPQTVAHKRSIKALGQQISQYQGFLSQLPSARENYESAKTVLAKLKAVPTDLPTDELSSVLSALSKEWKSLVQGASLAIPAAIVEDWKATEKKYKSKVSAVQESLKQEVKKTLGKLKTVQRMIEQGSFKPALATFKYAQKMYEGLPEKSQQGLSKLYTEVNQKAIELQELQAFIAGPRKPLLLEEVNALNAQNALEDISERASKVKSLRAQWNELGKLGTEQDEALNKAFDEAIEKAFQPCRAHYAEQDKVRAANADKAKSTIDALVALSSHDNMATLGRVLSNINKAWRAIGSLEQAERRKLQKAYQQALKPLQQRLDAFYSDNLQRKQALLKKVELLDSIEDIAAASESAKQYQQQWKEIGFSGKKTDDELWVAFRKANDAVFAKVNQKRESEAGELAQMKTEFHASANELQSLVANANEMKDLSEFEVKMDELAQKFADIPSRSARSEQQKLDAINKAHTAKQSEFEQQKSANQWQALFDTLAEWTDDGVPQSASALPNKYLQLLKAQPVNADSEKRKSLTIQAEIIADLPSNKADEAQRKKLQLQLMASRLEGSHVPSLNELLVDWISCGPLIKTDQALLKRLKKVILA